jgi:hypothetical protein
MTRDYSYSIDQCDVTDKRALQSYRDKRRLWLSWIDADEHHAIWEVLSSMVWTDVSFKTLTQFAIDDAAAQISAFGKLKLTNCARSASTSRMNDAGAAAMHGGQRNPSENRATSFY